MLDFLASPYLILFARLAVGGVFIVSGIAKLLDREGTAANMGRYPFLPSWSSGLIAGVVPAIELAVGLMLVFGILTQVAAVVAVGLFAVFTGLIVYDLTRGRSQSCHCFGRLSDERLTPVAVVRNAVLIVLSLLVAISFDGWLSVDSTLGLEGGTPSGFPSVADSVPIVLLALATVGAVVFGGQAVNAVRTTLRGLSIR